MKFYLYQLQAFDYLLKTITKDSKSPCCKEIDLKLVIKFNNELWSGDFIELKQGAVNIEFIDSQNKLQYNSYNKETSLFLLDAFSEIELCIEALISSDDYLTVFRTVAYKMINFPVSSDWKKDTEPNFPNCFFNVRNLESNLELPFIAFAESDVQIELVSVIDNQNRL